MFSQLAARDLAAAGATCRTWAGPARAALLWRRLVAGRWGRAAALHLPPGSGCWAEQYRRLAARVPRTLLTRERPHIAGVNQVAFSPGGDLMASCGEDARLLLWRGEKLVLEEDLHK